MVGYVYIMSNKKRGAIYIGVTSDMIKRIYEHKHKLIDGFTKKYDLKNLVYFEIADSIETAIARENQLKNWHRSWKTNLIERENPEWEDLYNRVIGHIMDAETSSA